MNYNLQYISLDVYCRTAEWQSMTLTDTIQGFRHPSGCIKPITVWLDDGRHEWVRCGQCLRCRIRRKQAWVGRCLLELASSGGVGRFITLTYDDAHLPPGLDGNHLRAFFDAYTYRYGAVRYLACGEYGERTGRPHYHVIFFGHTPQWIGMLENWSPWPHGHTFDGVANRHSIAYCAGYTLKNVSKAEKPMLRVSRRPGLGFLAVDRLAQQAPRSLRRWPGRYVFDGKSYPLMDGALARFKKTYVKSGGSPPEDNNPDLAYAIYATYASRDLGTRISSEREFWTELEYRHGTQGLPSKSRERL